MAVQKFKLELKSAKMITPGIRHMAFTRTDNQPLDYKPGQFISFLFNVDGKTKRRSFSIATIPGQTDEIEIAISYVKGGLASEALFNLEPGQTLDAMGPAGRLVLQEEPAKRILLTGTGTGIAPYRCMLPQIIEKLATNPALTITVILGVQYRQDALYAEDFRNFAKQHERLEFRVCYSREDLKQEQSPTTPLITDEYSGYVQHQFDGLNMNPDSDIVYLCGNPNMIDDSFNKLTAMGFVMKQVRREKYISPN
ncbi:FAD-binding oxidoreductase [Piscirickettsia salmonis]|uniref:Methane monooxygenase component C n=1 Tax=Piscirickettsia salmonis TaxID=1238 RepID=A0A9Q6PZ99_PISSA|nr:FAD-binding oxidoreductase [Piscirickettsia salmonis]RNC77942.1 ferredoxin--NADP(+) reductase [Piscirickettsiaceae bacterium NZ-RLO2]ALA26058.1 oxidoreductase NAD-binding domain protein [Piscirickettsia salmonis]APS43514.1 ferredoxin--NADP(+) reductase [Piscirickettsia salmonis]APS46867.1 ferredoxin--NADP(+) reductase [Piscirickettsia salmonis]APS58008.1 ferredoxin--NADP(+) reductase [Piscirickettsia salmonis]